jgi:hypothetical protein
VLATSISASVCSQHAGAAQQQYLKASNPDAYDFFGVTTALSGDGNAVAVGAQNESSMAVGIDGDQLDNSANSSGAAYLYQR